ncbi:phosphoglucosamine mutase [Cyclobacterium amurskyense]|mgnify:CR=1 FL=1|jgi:phosphomannomutase|uniref:Phosphomannomutase n=1 Tax=Cyclobacterium amurskyense TaxID=320787 RepID=A0A0H4P7L6_9BACT|nr:phosphoglucosamine mutase [Cyclobacterium amurskyense]AKP50446.1 Phosphomannomutase [Cyclobacterium amurskyense]|tara:strand:- start:16026 stop:17414 length:1389 start_codon:yes stop_codon:yes gene_type:complete
MALIKSISGIRGTIGGKPGEGLSPLDIVKFSAAYGAWVLENSPNKKIILGRDARISGQMVSQLVASTLQGLGLHVIDLGLSTTPTVELAVPKENAGGGIIITASHNPIQWNALKLLNAQGEFISDSEGKEVLDKAEKEDFTFAEVRKLGSYTQREDYLDIHIQHVLDLALVDKEAIAARKFKVVIDCVNSSGGIVVPKLLTALGVEVIEEMYCEPNGDFPHNPEPLPEHLRDISLKLENGNFDLGIVVDPDVDRLAFLNEDGSFFGEEYTLVAVADYVLSNQNGNTVSNLSSTRALRDVTERHGGEYHAAAVGEVNVVTQMKATNAIIGGEGNGGVIYPESHYGRDALVGIGLFLTHLAKFGKSASRLRATYPGYFISKNKIELTPSINVDSILDKIQRKYQKYPINTIDGVKIEFEKEWVHLRKSNTEPIIRIYSESGTAATADHLANKIILDIKEIISEK